MTELRIDIHVEETVYEAPSTWRLLGAKGKSDHVVALCEANGLKPRSLLDVGAGDGSILKCLSDRAFCGEMHAVEISKSGVEVILAQSIPSLKSCQVFDGYHLPFPDNSFDIAILSHVLEHVEFERALLRELVRVSRHQIIEIPMDWVRLHDEIYHALGPSYGHINAHSPDGLRFLLATENMVVLDEMIGRYSIELQEYDHFVNNSKEKTPQSVSEFRRKYREDETRFNALARAEKARSSSFCAVLSRKETRGERVARAMAMIKKSILSDQIQVSRLVFDYYIPASEKDAKALEVADGCMDARPEVALEYLERISDVFGQQEIVQKKKQAALKKIPVVRERARAQATWWAPNSEIRRKIGRKLPFLVSVVRALRRSFGVKR